MKYKYSKEESETQKVSEPEIQYDTVGANTAELMYPSSLPRTVSEEEIAQSFTLEEFEQHMNDLVESTHNHNTVAWSTPPSFLVCIPSKRHSAEV